MKILKSDLLPALKFLSGIVPTRTTLPVLYCFQVQAKDGLFTIRANSLSEYGDLSVPCQPGTIEPCCVLAKNFMAVVAAAEESIEIQFKNGCLVMRGNGEANLKTLLGEEFPTRQDAKAGKIGVNVQDLSKAIRLVKWIPIRNEAGREILDNLHIKTSSKNILCEATDGRLIAYTEIPSIASESDFCVPLSRVGSFLESLDREEAELSLSDKFITVTFLGGFHSITLPEAQYPNTKTQRSNGKKIGEISPADLRPKIKLCEGLMLDLFVTVKASFSEKGLKFSATGKEGDYSASVEGKFSPCDYTLNLKHISLVLSNFDDSPVSVSASDAVFYMAQGDLNIATVLIREK